jgi:hypothetical protein
MESALMAATCALFAFAALGYIIGSIAERTIVESIESDFHAQWQALEAAHHAETTSDAPAGPSDAA